ncbi:MAG: ATP-binding protein [Clostridiales bacterium]|nr:ATP-binding protein [Clostridiales bacterium]
MLIADLGISDVTVKKTNGNAPVITTTHRVEGEDGSVSYFQLLMEQESAGTQRFFSRIGCWLQALENGSLLVVDEIEDSLHPLLTRRLIEMIQDGSINAKGAQLLFTTHDAMLLDLSFLRRDQIWFAEKMSAPALLKYIHCPHFLPGKVRISAIRMIQSEMDDKKTQSSLDE